MNDESDVPLPQKSLGTNTTLITLGVVVCLMIAWVGFMRPKISVEKATKAPGVGLPLPALELQPLTGTTNGISLENLKGKVTLIDYWGPWCDFCIVEFPHLLELWDKNRGNPEFAFVSVSSGGSAQEDVPELREQTQKFLASRGATFPTYVDLEGKNRRLYLGIAGAEEFVYPTTILLDKRGTIRAVWEGYQPGFEMQMEQMVSKLLAEK